MGGGGGVFRCLTCMCVLVGLCVAIYFNVCTLTVNGGRLMWAKEMYCMNNKKYT